MLLLLSAFTTVFFMSPQAGLPLVAKYAFLMILALPPGAAVLRALAMIVFTGPACAAVSSTTPRLHVFTSAQLTALAEGLPSAVYPRCVTYLSALFCWT